MDIVCASLSKSPKFFVHCVHFIIYQGRVRHLFKTQVVRGCPSQRTPPKHSLSFKLKVSDAGYHDCFDGMHAVLSFVELAAIL